VNYFDYIGNIRKLLTDLLQNPGDWAHYAGPSPADTEDVVDVLDEANPHPRPVQALERAMPPRGKSFLFSVDVGLAV